MAIQKINVKKSDSMSRKELLDILNSARSTFQYARFNFENGIYINITYHRDQTIEISSNSRNIELWRQINSIRRTYSQVRVVEFLVRWVKMVNI